MPDAEITPEQLASALAARLIHDFIGPASGIVSAFDLIADPAAAAMRGEALDLAADSARRLVDLLVLSRTIYAEGADISAAELGAFGKRLFDGSRATLRLSVEVDPAPSSAARLVLGLLQTAAAAVAAGGAVVTRLASEHGWLVIEGRASGPRVRVAPEVCEGLAGGGPGSGPAHRWSAAYLMGALARSGGGSITASATDGVFVFRAVIRADTA